VVAIGSGKNDDTEFHVCILAFGKKAMSKWQLLLEIRTNIFGPISSLS
jgi:hypothetical protein